MKNRKGEFINEHFGDLKDGESKSCCQGAGCWRMENDKETPSQCSGNVKRDGDALVFNCFGAKCTLGGGIVSSEGCRSKNRIFNKAKQEHSRSREIVHLPNNFIRSVSGEELEWLEQYNITKEEIITWDIGTLKGEKRIVFPIYKESELQGYLIRDINPNAFQKWHKEGNINELIYTVVPTTTPESSSEGSELIIVESLVSALMTGRETPSVALLGTVITEEKLKAIKDICKANDIKQLILWLDKDVERKKLNKLKYMLTKRVMPCIVKTTNKKVHEIMKEKVSD